MGVDVSVVIPSYNRPDLLRRLLASVARQTYDGFEVIVVDDASKEKDRYEAVIRYYRDEFAQLRYLRNSKNKGAPASRNKGIRAAEGDLIALVDDDDEWKPEKLEKQVQLFRESGDDVGLVYAWADAVDEEGNVVHRYRAEIEGIALREILRYCFIPSPTVMVRKKAIVEVGLFDETMTSLQDRDMWTRIFTNGYSCRLVKETLSIYYIHGDESIGSSNIARYGYWEYLRKYWKLLVKQKEWYGIIQILESILSE